MLLRALSCANSSRNRCRHRRGARTRPGSAVAVATDPDVVQKLGRRDIVFPWCGTVTYLEWVEDLMEYQVGPKSCPDDKVKVESGFLDLYNSKVSACNYCSYSARD
ncbi:hypothetical protein AMTR_s00038p00114410 [Amborella trichopoda]|uniref:Uncharacterized protein n=1 Tax=Amborella trichopoda TaxID=13333 RepID=U5CN40_AMBTC|nr:hypothetical protein AMTR_s00038p00114410 [Amborella trichopoda]